MAPAAPADASWAGPPARALAIYAHPDDPDVACGGTLARWAASGAHVEVCICCDGDKGSKDGGLDEAVLVGRRREEAHKAAGVLGVARQHWLGYRDGELDDTAELRGRLVALLRSLRPEAVLAPDPTAVFFGPNYVNHRDHRVVGWAALDAVSPAAASPRYFPGAGPPYQVPALYLSGTLEPDHWVDIAGYLPAKAAALACHATQVGEDGAWLGEAVANQARQAGAQAGLAYAEAFRRVLLA